MRSPDRYKIEFTIIAMTMIAAAVLSISNL